MPPSRSQASRAAISQYDLRKVHIPYVCDDGTSSYLPRSAPRKAALLRERLLTRAAQKQTSPGPATRSGHRAPSPQLPQLPKTNRRKLSSKPSIPRDPPPQKPKPASKRAKRTVEPSDELAEELQEGEDLEEEDPEEADPEEEDTDLIAAQALLEAKDRFKKQRLRTYLQKKAVGVRAEVPEELTTSDIQ